jgi:hypothetical protein
MSRSKQLPGRMEEDRSSSGWGRTGVMIASLFYSCKTPHTKFILVGSLEE